MVFWMWCLAHKLELAMKDTLPGISFDLLDEMLHRLNYLYEISPKKFRELESILNNLKMAFHLNDEREEVRPKRA